jgi:hypothetical protein
MRALNAGLAGFLLSSAKGEAREILDWKDFRKRFRVTDANDVGIAQSSSASVCSRRTISLLIVSGFVRGISS